jgi:oligoribonuclease NrnB/cAMP/cGMP phosphodiesterase (DHH superfamily)
MGHSGAVLTWEYFHPGEPVPELLRYVEDRDLWRFALPDSREVSAALESYHRDFSIWDGLTVEGLAADGKPILRAMRLQVSRLADRVFFQDIAGYSVPVVNASLFNSDVLHELASRYPTAPFAACYFDRADRKRQWGLASIGSFDVSKIAKQFGGGGHRNRAGFMEQL